VDRGILDGLTRDGKKISKTYKGEISALMKDVSLPVVKKELQMVE
jgi:hypothetical protein